MGTARVSDRFQSVGRELEAEMLRLIGYVTDKVVPEVRRDTSTALRVAADQLSRMAEHLERGRKRAPVNPAGASAPSGAPR